MGGPRRIGYAIAAPLRESSESPANAQGEHDFHRAIALPPECGTPGVNLREFGTETIHTGRNVVLVSGAWGARPSGGQSAKLRVFINDKGSS